ncbi:MAG TPA: hypothetical protein VFH59_09450 [Frateuria sp.]|uniref:hypothetical protein n=1 Tax=Frateuria sp. TaxID=2211372 RepID=UPI002D801E5F|nr:hypothetical protein [Frateuria sp.]HET6805650.1 hypothetical protein [Frateuria sp.]
MFRRPMLFSGLAMALLAGAQSLSPMVVSQKPIPAELPRARRHGKYRPGLTRSRGTGAQASGFTAHGKRARQRRRTRALQGRD